MPPTEWTDRSHELAALLSRVGLGDRAAFATLYKQTAAHLMGVVVRINRDRAQAEDVLQELIEQYPDLLAGAQMSPGGSARRSP